MLKGLIHAHEGLAYLLVLSCSVSLVLSLVCAATGNTRVVGLGTLLARKVEPSLTGIIGLLGIVAWAMSGLSIATPYLWAGVVYMVFQGMWMARVTKPALLGLANSESQAGRWVVGALVQLVAALGIFTWMRA